MPSWRPRSKIFSGASTAFGAEPNTQACAVDLGLPGVLPVLNAEAVRMAVKFGLAIGCRPSRRARCSRARTISIRTCPRATRSASSSCPSCTTATWTSSWRMARTKRIGITRAHLEEDAGKSLHEDFHGMTGIDLNRAGTPLLEIVSEPDMRSAHEAVAYLKKMHQIGALTWASATATCRKVASAVMPMSRCGRSAQQEFGTRAEIKNLNSFRFVEQAIDFEIERQIDLIESGGKVVQETRLYDPQDRTKPAPCAARKRPTTTAIFRTRTCCRW